MINITTKKQIVSLKSLQIALIPFKLISLCMLLMSILVHVFWITILSPLIYKYIIFT